MKRILKVVFCVGSYIFLSACARLNPTPIIQYVEVTATHVTPTPTLTPTPTITPTPTAIPIDVFGDIRASRISTPSPQTNALCGVVDLLDFPLKPPDAIGTRGGTDFGVFRERYNGYHTGTDWGLTEGSNFGEPVYSIGHGVVTHADPDGWGPDKGTVVIAHTFPDGSWIYSFYGHLDPPSVQVVAGQCVTRGEKIGEIGRPRSSPHLHFEIRSIFPEQPVHGYLSYDPSIAGWEHPTQYILSYRIETSPGVEWMRSSPDRYIHPIGLINESAFLVEEDNQLVAIDLSNGQTRWTMPLTTSVADSAIDFAHELVYVINRSGELIAYSLPDEDPSNNSILNLGIAWEIDLDTSGSHELIPLPRSGVMVFSRGNVSAYSLEGSLLWTEEDFGDQSWWAYTDEDILLSTEGEPGALWRIPSSESPQLLTELTGLALRLDHEVLIYNQEGVYLLNPGIDLLRRVYPLTSAYPDLGSLLKISDEEVLIAHMDRFDRRLLFIDGEGNLRWDRSYEQVGIGEPQLLMLDSGPALLTQKADSRFETISILALDITTAELKPIFEGGPVALFPTDAWAQVLEGNHLLVNLTGSWMIMLNIQEALESASLVSE